jgi:hypothetical protein
VLQEGDAGRAIGHAGNAVAKARVGARREAIVAMRHAVRKHGHGDRRAERGGPAARALLAPLIVDHHDGGIAGVVVVAVEATVAVVARGVSGVGRVPVVTMERLAVVVPVAIIIFVMVVIMVVVRCGVHVRRALQIEQDGSKRLERQDEEQQRHDASARVPAGRPRDRRDPPSDPDESACLAVSQAALLP